jgi:hypothetical protein
LYLRRAKLRHRDHERQTRFVHVWKRGRCNELKQFGRLTQADFSAVDTLHMIYNAFLLFACVAVAFSPIVVERLSHPESFREMLGWKSKTRANGRTPTDLVSARMTS